MPRLPRVHLTGILYYVTQQGAQDRPLFRNAEDYQTYLDLLCQYKTKHEFKVFAFSFDPEKIHLIVEPYGETTISEIMRDLTSRYSKYCNGRYGGIGPLFKGRFHTIMAEKESLLVKLVHFVNSLSGATATTGVENSRLLFSAGRVEAVAPFKHSMKAELAEVSEKIAQLGFLGGAETLAIPMTGEKMDAMLKMFKDPVIGSPEFVSKIRGELSDAASRAHKVHAEVISGDSSDRPARGGIRVPRWAFAGMASLACAAVILPASFWIISKAGVKSVHLPVAMHASAAAQAEAKTAVEPKAIDRNTLHASVVVLEGTEWNLRLTPSNKQKQSDVEFDKISFLNDQVVSKKMAARGFQPTNYTLTTQVDGTVVWETMQTGPNGEKVFWRGEWNENGMSGVLSQQEVGGELQTFQFMGSR